jgi:hypothetical protein
MSNSIEIDDINAISTRNFQKSLDQIIALADSGNQAAMLEYIYEYNDNQIKDKAREYIGILLAQESLLNKDDIYRLKQSLGGSYEFNEETKSKAFELYKEIGYYNGCARLSDDPLYWLDKAVFNSVQYPDWPGYCLIYINKYKSLNKHLKDEQSELNKHQMLRPYYEKFITLCDKANYKVYKVGKKNMYNEICDILGGDYISKKSEADDPKRLNNAESCDFVYYNNPDLVE